MIPLHQIRIAGLEAYIWAVAYGYNGRIIGTRDPYWNPRHYHAYSIERGTPPPMMEGAADYLQRSYWVPWRFTGQQPREWYLTPACGRIQSRAQNPRMNFATATWGPVPPQQMCRACLDAVGTVHCITDLQRNDPWNLIERRERNTTPDPLTGG